MARAPILLAVDGNSLAVRAHHAYAHTGITNSAGKDISTVFGFFTLLIGICHMTRPDAVVVGFDDQRTSLRRLRYPEYKAQRGSQTSQLFAHIADIYLALSQLGIATVIPPGLEADDVVASSANSARCAGWLCVVATSDRDAFSSISPTTTVLRLFSGLHNAQRMTPRTLRDTLGIDPAQYIDYAALRGDASDNLPGIAGIGPKTAAKVLNALGTIHPVLDSPSSLEQILGTKLATKLTTPAARATLIRNLALMTPQTDMDLSPEDHRLRVSARTVRATFAALELPSLSERAVAAFCPTTHTPSSALLAPPMPHPHSS
jgi:DNA polymerase-1